MRGRLLVAFGVLGGLAASPVSARYGYCEAFQKNAASFGPADSQYPLMLSGILDFGEKGENYAESEKQFRVFLFNNSVTCDSSHKTVKDAAAAKRRRMEFSQGNDKDTGWTGSFAATGEPNAESRPSGGAFISIKDNGIAARTKAWDDAMLQGQRVEAQRRVAAAAVSAQQDAKIKALIAVEMEKMRKRGNKQ